MTNTSSLYVASAGPDIYHLIDPARPLGIGSLRAVIINWADQIEVRPRKDVPISPAEDRVIVEFCEGLTKGKS